MTGAAFLALGLVAGMLNTLAGGGPIIVVAVLAALGLSADIASLTSTVALLPGQVIAAYHGRAGLAECGPPRRRRALVAIALAGGAVGALLLLLLPARIFAQMLPWLVLFATGLYALNSRAAPLLRGERTAPRVPNLLLFGPLAIYGGFYGGGNSFLVLAMLAHARLSPRGAVHAKNVLILAMNAAATLIFVWSGKVAWAVAVPLSAGAIAGGLLGTMLVDRIDPVWLRRSVIACGVVLGIGLLFRF